MSEGMYKVDLNGLMLEVGQETFLLLKDDPVFRKNYEKAIYDVASQKEETQIRSTFLKEINLAPSPDEDSLQSPSLLCSRADLSSKELVWTTKKSSIKDIEATGLLLKLRKDWAAEFDDPKTSKTTLWSKIANKLNNKNLYVGEGAEAAEKCRKKFSNLQSSYIKYKDKKRQTGEGAVAKPPFFSEIDEILGTKDKVCPQIVIDSTNTNSIVKNKPPISIYDLESQPSTSSAAYKENLSPTNIQAPNVEHTESQPKNRFECIKTSSKPNKDIYLKELVSIQKEDMVERREEFNRIMTFLETSAQQRHEQVMAFLKQKRGKKRGRDSSCDSE